ncbi:RNA polymerase sigma factor [Actinomadura montaniterrae]|uniref:Sigma-70 family RNA polymerase sigma factor n=1 Tax=Actinomadura montaniterrae TaxID=1803903 RepID=A0A6L3W7B8_9ACTN|nr:sigma-70 family RNA polymerase sigma factor [Actinomadura montaniterrae]KAB2390282.1 sigma-70 family RNA polymerase sigma factor [Actinomadura montaniterrae]
MTADPDDAELIARSLGGDVDAFMEVVRRHEAAVGAYLARRAGRDAAEDLLGEVWVAALASRAAYDRSFPGARPWLFGVAHNVLRRHWRSRPAEEPRADVPDAVSGWDPWAAVDDRVDAEPVLLRALALLRPQQREILALVAWEDLTVADAGRAIGMPPGTARRYLHEARAALRDAPGMAALLTEHDTIKEAR